MTSRILVFVASLIFISCKATLKQQSDLSKDNLLIEKMYLEDVRLRELDAKTDTINLEQYVSGNLKTDNQLQKNDNISRIKRRLSG